MAKLEIDTSYLNAQEFRELARVRKDLLYFSKFIYVIHPMRGKVKFDLYPYQKSVLYYFLKQRFNIILKFRQAGITELISMYCLWLAMYHPNKKINIISIKDTTAKKVLKKMKYMYRNLPEHIKVPIVNGRKGDLGTAQMMEFANGSFIESIPTTEEAGRSESLSLLVIDEAAMVRWASTIWAAAFPTLSTGGSAIVNSTPAGVGDFYHNKWVDAITGNDVFHPIRLRWEMHPERDQPWYDTMSKALGRRRTAQEIDGDFLSSGNTVFDLADIKAIEESFDDYPEPRKLYNGQMGIYGKPIKGERYFIGADIATGRSSDYSAFKLGNQRGEEFGYFKGRVPVERFAKILGDIGTEWNDAVLAPETNDVGLAVTTILQTEGYQNLYYYKKILKKKRIKQRGKAEISEYPGWLTTSQNRSVIIEGLETDLRNETYICKDPFFINEAYTFIYDTMGRPVAMGKHRTNSSVDIDLEGETYSDDDIFATAIYNHIRKVHKPKIIVQPH